MTSPPVIPDDDDDSSSYLSLEAIDRDLERLGELTGPYVSDLADDLALAAARIPGADLRHEAEELLGRLRPLVDSYLADGIMADRELSLPLTLRRQRATPQHRRAPGRPRPSPWQRPGGQAQLSPTDLPGS